MKQTSNYAELVTVNILSKTDISEKKKEKCMAALKNLTFSLLDSIGYNKVKQEKKNKYKREARAAVFR